VEEANRDDFGEYFEASMAVTEFGDELNAFWGDGDFGNLVVFL
jgi:hypothetical protein